MGKGSDDSSQSSGNVSADTLMSKTIVRLVDLVSEGPCLGLVNSAQSVYFNKTPWQNPDGTLGVLGINVITRLGYPVQDVMPGFADIENEVEVNQVVKCSQGPVTQTVQNSNIDAVRVKISLNSFLKGDAQGNVNPTLVQFQIQYRSSGGIWKTGYYDNAYFAYSNNPSPNTDALKCGTSLQVGAGGDYQLIFYYKLHGSSTYIEGGRYEGNNTGGDTIYYPVFNVFDLPYGQYDVTLVETVGNIVGNSYNYTGYHNPDAYITIYGKTSSGYVQDYRMDLPSNGAPWEIRVLRITADAVDFTGAANNATYTQDEITFASYTEIIDTRVMYSDSVVFGITSDTQYNNQGLPTRGYDMYGRIVRVPANYDAFARTYTGLWDGTFKLSWTNNPVWCFLDILTHDRYGLGQYITDDFLDFSALYLISKYCDVLVPDGVGGTEPRFTFNTQITSQGQAYDVLNMFVSVFRGMLYWATGQVTASQDRPGPVSRVVTRANVLNTGFSYTGVPLNARHSVVLVTWNDPENFYEQVVDVVEDPDLKKRFGYVTLSVTAFGCTSRGQALRTGRWILDTEKYATDVVTYRAGWDHADALPGELIAVSDPAYAGLRQGGRVVSATSTTITMDAPYEFTRTETYHISVVIPTWGRVTLLNGSNAVNGSRTAFLNGLRPILAGDIIVFEDENRQYQVASTPTDNAQLILTGNYLGTTRSGANFSVFRNGTFFYSSLVTVVDCPLVAGINGVYTTVTLDGTLPGVPNNGVPFVLTGTDVAPRLFRIVNNKEVAPQTFEISALEYDPTKYDRVETGYQAKTTKKLIDDTSQLPQVKNIQCVESLYKANNQVRTRLTISWQPVADTRVAYYQLVYSYQGSPFQLLSGTSDVSFDMVDETPGAYVFGVRTVGNIAASSPFTYFNFTALGKSAPPADVTSFIAIRTISGAQLTWIAVADIDVVGYEIRQGTSWDTGTIVTTEMNGTTEFVVLNDTSNHTFFIKALDDTGHYSVNAVSIVTSVIAPDDVTGFLVTQDGDRVIFNWDKVVGTDIRYEIREGDSFVVGRPVALVSGNTANVMYPLTDNRTFWIKALSGVGLYSVNASFTEVFLVATQDRNIIVTTDRAATHWPGANYGMEVTGPFSTDLSLSDGILQGHHEFQILLGYPYTGPVRARVWYDYTFVSDAATPSWADATFTWGDPQAQVPWQPLLDIGTARVDWFISTNKTQYGVTVDDVWTFETSLTGDLGTTAIRGVWVTSEGVSSSGTLITVAEPAYTITVATIFTLQISIAFNPQTAVGDPRNLTQYLDRALQILALSGSGGKYLNLYYKMDINSAPRLLLTDGNAAHDMYLDCPGLTAKRLTVAIVQDATTRSLYLYDWDSTVASRVTASIATNGPYSQIAA